MAVQPSLIVNDLNDKLRTQKMKYYGFNYG